MSNNIFDQDRIREIIELAERALITRPNVRDGLWAGFNEGLQSRVDTKKNPNLQIQADLIFLNNRDLIVERGKDHPLVQWLKNAASLASHLKQSSKLKDFAKQAKDKLAQGEILHATPTQIQDKVEPDLNESTLILMTVNSHETKAVLDTFIGVGNSPPTWSMNLNAWPTPTEWPHGSPKVVSLPKSKWWSEDPPGTGRWRDALETMQDELLKIPRNGVLHLYSSIPYAFAPWVATVLHNQQSHPPQFHQHDYPSKTWPNWSHAPDTPPNLWRLRPKGLDTITPKAAVALTVSITREIDEDERIRGLVVAGCPNISVVRMSRETDLGVELKPAKDAIPNPTQALHAAWQLTACLDHLNNAPVTRIHLFYAGPLGILLEACRRANLWPELVVHERASVDGQWVLLPATVLHDQKLRWWTDNL